MSSSGHRDRETAFGNIDDADRTLDRQDDEARRDGRRRKTARPKSTMACMQCRWFLLLHSKELRAEMPADPFFVLCTPF